MALRFGVVMRDWLAENFPEIVPGQEHDIVGLFIPVADPKHYKPARWVASMRLEGGVVWVWHNTTKAGAIGHKFIALGDPEFFNKMKEALTTAQQHLSESVLWLWPEIR